MRVVLTVKCCKHPLMIIYAHKHPQNITKQFQNFPDIVSQLVFPRTRPSGKSSDIVPFVLLVCCFCSAIAPTSQSFKNHPDAAHACVVHVLSCAAATGEIAKT